ncbi:MAG: methyltransferase domain-containing protein [Sphingobacteriales bacterium]|nr:MAG: methyltransferase domain-containing protein [Sphingobacteriales bacterium]
MIPDVAEALAAHSPFANRLTKVWKHYAKLARRQQVACFRVYDHDLTQYPFVIEWLDGAVYVSEYLRRHGMEEAQHEQWLAECRAVVASVLAVPEENVYLKERRRKASRYEQYEKLDLQKIERIVPEDDLFFILNLSDYLDTGLFLDHRITRRMVREESAGKSVLNLFCYTGAFSVHAAKGGAEQVVSVDMSKTYINWAKRNMQFNKLIDDKAHFFIQDDVLEWIKDLPKNSFDIIICDPPTFSNSKRMDETWDVQRDHVPLIKKLLTALTPDGVLYFSTNCRNFVLERDALPTDRIEDITRKTTPFDFEGRLFRYCFRINR